MWFELYKPLHAWTMKTGIKISSTLFLDSAVSIQYICMVSCAYSVHTIKENCLASIVNCKPCMDYCLVCFAFVDYFLQLNKLEKLNSNILCDWCPQQMPTAAKCAIVVILLEQNWMPGKTILNKNQNCGHILHDGHERGPMYTDAA